MPHTLTLEIPDPIYEALADLAERRGKDAEEVALSAIEHLTVDPLEKYIGSLTGGPPGWADRIDDYLAAEALDAHESDA